VRIKALVLIGFWIVLQVVLGVVGLSGPEEGGVAYWAHVGGFLTGLALVSVFSRRPTPAA
jgi:membrane associated rhomboid family serine protease